MRTVLGLLLGLLLPFASAGAAAKQRQQVPDAVFSTAAELMDWISGYRHNPEPDRLPDAVRAMRALGLIKDIEAAGVFIGFTAGVLGANQDKAEALIAKFYPMPPEDQVFIIKAIAYSGLPAWKELLGTFVERMPARKVLLNKYLYGDGKTLYELPLEDGMAPLDTLWGYYYATGSYEPILRVIRTLEWAGEKEDIDKLTAGSMAKWTLASNGTRDPALVELYAVELKHQSETISAQLREVVDAAELFETNKLKRNALAAIDEVRRKGPQKKSTWWSWTAGAAPTAVGLACVVAAAAGQVEFGVPCLVGGALSNVGAKYFGSP